MPNGETGGFLERLRNSPRTVSTIIVILIVVGAIFAFSDRGKPAETPTPLAAVSETSGQASPAAGSEETAEPEREGTRTEETSVEERPREPTPLPAATPLPKAEETENAYIEVASPGEGVTHLARKAMLQYLEANKPDFEVAAEHKVWIEDYVKDQVGRERLAIGATKTIEKGLLREAVEKSKALTDAQRKNLQRYSRLVAAYR